MRRLFAIILLLGFAATGFAGPMFGFSVLRSGNDDPNPPTIKNAPMTPDPVMAGIHTPAINPDLPKEVTLAEAPAQDCAQDGVIIRGLLPMFFRRLLSD